MGWDQEGPWQVGHCAGLGTSPHWVLRRAAEKAAQLVFQLPGRGGYLDLVRIAASGGAHHRPKSLRQRKCVQNRDRTGAQNQPGEPLLRPPFTGIRGWLTDGIDETAGLGVGRRVEDRALDEEAFKTDKDRHQAQGDEN